MSKPKYAPLDTRSLVDYLQGLPDIEAILGKNRSTWQVREVGDGNLNLVFVVTSSEGGLVAKQALPYVRLVGESWPLPLKRSYFEGSALHWQAKFAPGLTPQVYHQDDDMALIVMEYLSPHITLRKGLIQKNIYPHAAEAIANFMALTLYNTSVLASSAEAHKLRIEQFASNTALCKITEDLVFTDPFRVAPLNRWTSPQLDAIKISFEQDAALKLAAQEKKWRFLTHAEALIHGDLHTGSVMVTETDTRVIDPEFAFVGPMGFDIGAIIANYLLSFFAHNGQQVAKENDAYCHWLLQQMDLIWSQFELHFMTLWQNDGTGDAFGHGLFEGGQLPLADYRQSFMKDLLQDSLGFAGCKMIRRILGLAHVEDLESIADPQVRALCEIHALNFARELLLNARSFQSISAVAMTARQYARMPAT